jgi:hexosaminidase
VLASVTCIGALASLCAVAARPAVAASPDAPAGDATREVPSVIPAPASVTRSAGSLTITTRTPVVAAEGEAKRVAQDFADLVSRTRGLALQVRAGPAGEGSAIAFALDIQAPAGEGYDLDIAASGVTVRAQEPRGLFYGAVTLWSLLTAEPGARTSATATLPAVRIQDTPRFAWRGFMLDSARHYQSPAFIKQMLDWMALHKLNTFHWHLTDDQGWRLQIRKYPRLTDVGAWRVPAGAAAAADIDPKTGKPRMYGGFYTQDEVRDIVAHAASRFITVVPEIEMPGHAQAPIAAYPALGTDAQAPPVSSDWGIHTYLYNVDETTFGFLEDVLKEVMALFPSRYIHVAGDEAVKDRWRASPAVQRRMRELGVPNEAALQSYFTQRMERFLSSHGRRLIGWDEILEGGGLPASATVMSWRGTAGGIEAANSGHDVVMSPAPTMYLDHLQSDLPDEPPGRPTYITLRDMYSFNVLPEEIEGDAARHVIGAQINAWTEHMRTPERVEHATFPRMAAFAETVWAPTHSTWQTFLARMPAQLARYQKLGIHYADSLFAVKLTGTTQIELSNQATTGDIRYTLNGANPTSASTLYTKPFSVPQGTTITAAVFINDQRVSTPRSRTFDRASALTRTDTDLKSCSNKLVLRLEDDAPLEGNRALFNVDILDPCWTWEKADLTRITGISASIGQIPFNFQVADAVKQIPLVPPATPAGELEVRAGSCEGERIAVLPLAPAAGNHELTSLPRVPVARVKDGAVQDLCLRFTRRSVDPIWVLKSVRLFE